jgi:hypothetical protein
VPRNTNGASGSPIYNVGARELAKAAGAGVKHVSRAVELKSDLRRVACDRFDFPAALRFHNTIQFAAVAVVVALLREDSQKNVVAHFCDPVQGATIYYLFQVPIE